MVQSSLPCHQSVYRLLHNSIKSRHINRQHACMHCMACHMPLLNTHMLSGPFSYETWLGFGASDVFTRVCKQHVLRERFVHATPLAVGTVGCTHTGSGLRLQESSQGCVQQGLLAPGFDSLVVLLRCSGCRAKFCNNVLARHLVRLTPR